MKKFIENFWFSRGYKHDKPKHFWRLGAWPAIGMFVITLFHFFRDLDYRVWLADLAAFLFVLCINIGKEVIDWKFTRRDGTGRFDPMDIVAALMGCVFMLAILNSVYFLITALWVE